MNEASANRASRRIDVHYDAVLVTSDGHEFRAVVKDLSAGGFRIEMETDEQLHADEQIILRTDRGGDVPAQIAWALGLEAGGTFLAKSEIT